MIRFPRIFRWPERPSPAMKRFMARYISYLEIFGTVMVSLVALAVAACFFVHVDDVITGDAVAIKPRAETIKRQADALVTRVFVKNHQSVHRGDVLIEVVESPKWMSRYLVMRQMQALLDEINSPGQAAELAKKRIEAAQKEAREAALAQAKKAGPNVTETEETQEESKTPLPAVSLTPEEDQLRASVQHRLAEWEKQEIAKSPRITIRSPIDGIVVAPDDLEFKKVDADAEMMKVVDLNDLRLTPKLWGETVADARVGQQANVKAIIPEYKKGLVFRGDTVPQGRYFWQKERITSYSVLDPKIKEVVKEAFKGRKITQRDDIPFKVKEVTDVEVDAEIQTVPSPPSSALAAGTARAGEQLAYAATARFAGTRAPGAAGSGAAGTPGARPIQGDTPTDMALSGRVVEGKHVLSVQIADLPPAVRQRVTRMVADQLRGKVIDAPLPPPREGGPTPEDSLRVEGVQGVQIIAKVKGENTKTKGPTKRLKAEAARSAVRGSSFEKQNEVRQFEATVQIENPPQFLKDRVLELLDQGKEVKAKVELRTGRRPVAFLLLKR